MEDDSFKNIIDKTTAMIIEKAVDEMRHDVQEKLKIEKEYVSSRHGYSFARQQIKRPIFIQTGKEVEKSYWNF